MKIQLPNNEKITLDSNISLEDKLVVVENLIKEWMPTIELNWDSKSVRFLLDGLANYLVWHKELEERGTEDKDVLSVKKVEEMVGKRKSRSVPFTSLSKPQREDLGLEDARNE